MNCVMHYDLQAVALCQVCGSGLCPTCAQAYHPPVCENCLSRHYQKTKQSYLTSFLISLIFLIAIVAFSIYSGLSRNYTLTEINLLNLLIIGLWFGSIPQGWVGLGRIPRSFLIFGTDAYSPTGQFIPMSSCLLLMIRAVLAYLLGPIFMVIRIVQYLLFARKLRQRDQRH